MSRAFTREDDNDPGLGAIGERPVSPHRNLVTPRGLALIEAELAALREAFAAAEAAGDRGKMTLASRDLRYWTARRETAEPVEPEPGSQVVRFGMSVTVEAEDATRRTWRIVGEDEADAAQGSISHVSPMAQALFGKGIGDVASVAGRDWEIVAIG